MQALLIPLWLKRVANDALVESQGHSPAPAQAPWQVARSSNHRLSRWQVIHYLRGGVIVTLPKLILAAATAKGLSLGSGPPLSLSEAGYLWFQSGFGGEDEGSALGL